MNLGHKLTLCALSAILLLGLSGQRDAKAEQEYVSKAMAATLHHAAIPGAEGKEVIVKHFAFPPGFVGGKHFHPGAVYVYVLEGALTVETAEGIKTYGAGELYPEEVNTVMQGKNLSTTDDLEILVFQVGDVGEPMMVKAD